MFRNDIIFIYRASHLGAFVLSSIHQLFLVLILVFLCAWTLEVLKQTVLFYQNLFST